MSKMNQRMTKYTNYRIFQRINYYRNERKRSENIRNTNHSLARPYECCHQAGASAPLTTRSRQFKIPGNIYSLRIITINRMTQIIKKGISLYYRLHPDHYKKADKWEAKIDSQKEHHHRYSGSAATHRGAVNPDLGNSSKECGVHHRNE